MNTPDELKQISLLYVEDDEDIRLQVAHFLHNKVGQLWVAGDRRQGLESFIANQPDIVLSDIILESSVERAGVCGFPGAGHTRQPTAWAQEAQRRAMVVPLQGVATPPCARKAVQSSQSRSYQTGEREMHDKVV